VQIGDIGKAVETYAVATRLHKPQSPNLDASSGVIGKHYFTLKMMEQLVKRAAAAA